MTVTEIVVREARFFRSKKKCDTALLKAGANGGAGIFIESVYGLVQGAIAHGSRANYVCAVENSVCNRAEFFGAFEDRGGADGGRCIVKSKLIRIDKAEMMGSEVRHGASGRADVLGIAWADENDSEIFQIGEMQVVHSSGICPSDFGFGIARQAENSECARILVRVVGTLDDCSAVQIPELGW